AGLRRASGLAVIFSCHCRMQCLEIGMTFERGFVARRRFVPAPASRSSCHPAFPASTWLCSRFQYQRPTEYPSSLPGGDIVMKNPGKRLVTLMGGAAFSRAATASQAEAPAPLDPPQKVKAAYVPIMKFATLYVAQGRD